MFISSTLFFWECHKQRYNFYLKPMAENQWKLYRFLSVHQFLLATKYSQKRSPCFLHYIESLFIGIYHTENVFSFWRLECYRPALQSDPSLTHFLGSTIYLSLKTFIIMKRGANHPYCVLLLDFHSQRVKMLIHKSKIHYYRI